jgi:hypothetical protein
VNETMTFQLRTMLNVRTWIRKYQSLVESLQENSYGLPRKIGKSARIRLTDQDEWYAQWDREGEQQTDEPRTTSAESLNDVKRDQEIGQPTHDAPPLTAQKRLTITPTPKSSVPTRRPTVIHIHIATRD